MDCSPPGTSVHGNSPGKNTGGGCHALLQGIMAAQGSNSGLPQCRQTLYCPSHWGWELPYLFIMQNGLLLSCTHGQKKVRTSLVVQWIGIHCLPMPGTGVQSLVWEDSICHGQLSVYATITKPRPQLLKPTHLEPVLHKKRSHSNGSPCITVKSPCSLQLAKACTQQQRPSATKEKLKTEA